MAATCKEASTGFPNMYVPCGQPAVQIIGWKGRSDAPLPMCKMCAYHNVKNRGGYVVADIIQED